MPVAYPLNQTSNRSVPRGWNGTAPAPSTSPAGGNGPGNSQPYPLQQHAKPEETHWWQHPIAATEQLAHSVYQKGVNAVHDLEDDSVRAKHLVQAFSLADDLLSPILEKRLAMKVEELKKAFLPGLGLCLAFLAATTLGGAAIGGAIGFFAGGVGAVPGAIAGGEVGLDAGLALLDYIGLTILIVHIATELPNVIEKVRQGAHTAWNAGTAKSSVLQIDINRAAHELAEAEADLVVIIIDGVLAWILKDSAALRTEKLIKGLGTLRAGMKDAEVLATRANEILEALRNKPAEIEAALKKAAEEFATKIRKTSRLLEGLVDFVNKNLKKMLERGAKKAQKQIPKQIEAKVGGGGSGETGELTAQLRKARAKELWEQRARAKAEKAKAEQEAAATKTKADEEAESNEPDDSRISSEADRAAFRQAYGPDRYARDAKYIDYLRERHPEWDGIPTEDLVAVRGYTSSDYYNINQALRSGDAEQISAYESYIKCATSGLEQLPSYTGVVTRGTQLSADQIAGYVPGSIYTDPAFLSTSTDTSTAFGGNTEFTVISTSGSDVSSLSFHPGEQEVLFPPGTGYEVLEKYVDPKTGITKITLSQLGGN